MSDMKTFTFHYQDEEYNRKEENIVSRGYKKAVKSFQNKYPKAKNIKVMWSEEEDTNEVWSIDKGKWISLD